MSNNSFGENNKNTKIRIGDTYYTYGMPFGSGGCHVSLPNEWIGKLLKIELVRGGEAELDKKLEELAGGKQETLF